ncbi:multiple antibiotic resistance protein [Thioclava sp. ES.031]|uniref:MarC family protein n=1 Tax=unclassified Thioclava TaxID=2621713 RepID=UPI000996A2B2|nr:MULTISPECIES: MarC family protein [unclassified Thioclava]OOY07679.1 MarC family transcriptional regulator [Thioclava sp. F36-7]OOY31168.1 MarC family transcriptional regulator [Thioclava sp. F36-6]PFG64096.1 multiple antibiotic resistance protein [Thioclava sp. ES.031]
MIGAEYITAFVTLFVIIDPIGLAPVFIALTLGESHRARLRIAFRALIIAAVLLTLFGIFGDKILAGIGISMPAFRIAGGVLLFLTALDMLFERRTKRREAQGEEHEADPETDPSVFPLATPLLAGPGAMATMILLAGREGGDWLHVVAIIAMMLLVLGCVLVMFLLATPIERALGRTGTMVVTRLLGMLLAALAIQFILDGLHGAGLMGGVPTS